MNKAPNLSFSCPMNWDVMPGSETTRFCDQCQRSVHNLSTLSETERETLLERAKTERVCVAYYRRLNGEIVTDANAIHAYRKRLAAMTALAVASAGLAACSHTPDPIDVIPPESSVESIDETMVELEFLMGDICVIPDAQ